ncbi:hypothetical protein CALCODRAFT_499747 [Calocera cornea HHB12733]|uniref:HBS1-like protein N-terminal domain-containing protein n=1 Tax=Calocera cornea HHB12733 TaxID=1353952 RepID=A0A165EBY3_9BASI|nr:hypothetical protein CALCODRAFT_499747 [Calocera cornea HHB12733]
MSRHRLVRNLDLDEEMAEDDDFGEPEPELSESDNAKLQSACDAVREVIGPADESGIPDDEVADAVWELYFDVEQSVAYLLEQRDKRLEKQKKGKLRLPLYFASLFSYPFRLPSFFPQPALDIRPHEVQALPHPWTCRPLYRHSND